MAPVAKRLTISAAGSTSSIGTGLRAHAPRRYADAEHAAQRHQLLGLVVDRPEYVAELLRERRPSLRCQVAAHRMLQVGDHVRAATCAPRRGCGRHIRRRRPSALSSTGTLPNAGWWRSAVSRAIWRRPMPSTWVCVPVKYLRHERAVRRPTASKICAPQ